MSNTNYTKYGLEGLSAVQKGEKLIEKVGTASKILKMTDPGKAVQLIGTGLTPGGGAALITGLEAADVIKDAVNSDDSKELTPGTIEDGSGIDGKE